MINFFLIVVTLLLGFCPSAYAHMPYLEKYGYVTDDQGNGYILETLNGDGVIGSDPYVMQIRTLTGHVVAYVEGELPFVCFTLEYCFAAGWNLWRFDSDAIKRTAFEMDKNIVLPRKPNDETYEKFIEYMEDKKIKRTRAFLEGYPEDDEKYKNPFNVKRADNLFFPLLILGQFILLFYYLPAYLILVYSVSACYFCASSMRNLLKNNHKKTSYDKFCIFRLFLGSLFWGVLFFCEAFIMWGMFQAWTLLPIVFLLPILLWARKKSKCS